jgi:hypothetical protein
MKALLVYESLFGNTEIVARAVTEGLSDVFDVTMADVRDLPSPVGYDLLIAGAPAHAFGRSRATTRQEAARRGTVRPGAADIGLREYLDALPDLGGMAAAAFDTRPGNRMTGSAARRAHRKLRRHGGDMLLPAAGFRLLALTGPVAEGELRGARRWGKAVSATLLTHRHLRAVTAA